MYVLSTWKGGVAFRVKARQESQDLLKSIQNIRHGSILQVHGAAVNLVNVCGRPLREEAVKGLAIVCYPATDLRCMLHLVTNAKNVPFYNLACSMQPKASPMQ